MRHDRDLLEDVLEAILRITTYTAETEVAMNERVA
jgi:hypothetical protein